MWSLHHGPFQYGALIWSAWLNRRHLMGTGLFLWQFIISPNGLKSHHMQMSLRRWSSDSWRTISSVGTVCRAWSSQIMSLIWITILSPSYAKSSRLSTITLLVTDPWWIGQLKQQTRISRKSFKRWLSPTRIGTRCFHTLFMDIVPQYALRPGKPHFLLCMAWMHYFQ